MSAPIRFLPWAELPECTGNCGQGDRRCDCQRGAAAQCGRPQATASTAEGDGPGWMAGRGWWFALGLLWGSVLGISFGVWLVRAGMAAGGLL